MFTTVRTAAAVVLVGFALSAFNPATAAQAAESELWFRKAEKVALARGIQQDGFACSELTAVYFVEARSDGNHMRAVCRTGKGLDDSTSFRLTVRGSGGYRVGPWDDAPAGNVQFAGFVLRTSLN